MAVNGLFLWVEGSDDQTFIEQIFVGAFQKHYDWVQIVPYASRPRQACDTFLQNIRSMQASYIFFADYDSAPSVKQRLMSLTKAYTRCEVDHIHLVVQEIESWYLAGLTRQLSYKMGIPYHDSTNFLLKEDFNQLIPQNFASRRDFMGEILRNYSLKTAVSRNTSLARFVNKYSIPLTS